MCRIAGIVNSSSNSLEDDILKMRDSMRRGGPDDAGIYINPSLNLAFGHRRLSLLDLSPAGHQPMFDAKGRIAIVFNGEVYNFQEIKDELIANGYTFTNTTDTEVIIYSYLHWGVECFKRFNGMFSIALLDLKTSDLFLVRDFAGIKPLYYFKDNEKLIFASEIRAFKALDPAWPENEEWKIAFLAYGHIPEPLTTLANVHPLEKGSVLKIHLPTMKEEKINFADFTYKEDYTDLDFCINEVKRILPEAVNRQMVSDAPIGLFLSGGIDSSLLTLLAAKQPKETLHTLSIVFEDQKYSEEKYQQIIAEKAGIKHQSFLVTENEFRASFSDIMEAMDQPSIDGINSYFISKYAREYGLTAVLSGLGADELFGGYDSNRRSSHITLLKKVPSFVWAISNILGNSPKTKLAYLADDSLTSDYLFYRGLYTPRQISKILGCDEETVHRTLKKVTVAPCNSPDTRQQAAHLETHLFMQNQLLKDTDYMSMWHGLEVRVPFLDKELINLASRISPQIKYDPKKLKKYLLIEAFKDILPQEIYNRQKQGFTFPFAKWMENIVPKERSVGFQEKYQAFKTGKLHWSRYWASILVNKNSHLHFLQKDFKKVKFLNLIAFSGTGGIEKFNRSFLKALWDLESAGVLLADASSAYDGDSDPHYFPTQVYRGYKKHRNIFVVNEAFGSRKYDEIFIGHVNLGVVAFLIKIFNPKVKVTLIAHGIEVWKPLTGIKKWIVNNSDHVLSVSNFTKQQLLDKYTVPASRISIFPNTIDPYFQYPDKFEHPDYLRERYNIRKDEKVIFTLTRLSHTEKYKGYDQVLECLPALLKTIPNVKYVIAGKADDIEYARVTALIDKYQLQDVVILAGFIKDEEIVDHYLMADIFIMPSQKEGFGIVFIEAMACGLPVIAGNKDGSVDALMNGQLGTLIDPDDKSQILAALQNGLQNLAMQNNLELKAALQKKVLNAFGFDAFKNNLKTTSTN
ncbi:asparagine synthase (glutamine-hydrolyzing) [Mucilaginibacter sp. HMF5004]|uniref:asparagine synthase (glutamine-hydrolyzing) n=1 Tax=Mucilaginibacter rivuli TaxID=2857527 RepID=UPI001C5F273A|nr:asparagine synthase (glutamine-hydrolyzing) [Mucilaginibacter rivuli]MBW4890079.1 asparagine synthase (glutamine-hydrolyzing) [Mucilaginibacter rivuli]